MDTEAEGLFRAGALYKQRLGLRRSPDSLIMVGFKPGGFSIYRDDAPFFHFDLEGRWQRCLIDGPHLVKSLGNDVIEIDRVRQGVNLVLKRRSLSLDEIRALDDRVRDQARSLLNDLDVGRLEVHPPPALGDPLPIDDLQRFLVKIEGWDEAAWTRHRQRYEAAYHVDQAPNATSMLVPPDLGTAVVLHGMAQDFAGHVDQVAELLGARATQSRVAFLGGSGFLRSEPDLIAARLGIVARRFPLALGTDRRHVQHQAPKDHRFQALHAALDHYEAIPSTVEDWTRFQNSGLTKVHLEIESGSPAIRAASARPSYDYKNSSVQAVVGDLKAAGMDLGLIIPLVPDAVDGLGPEAHLRETAELLSSLELGHRDVVSLVVANEINAETFADRQAGFRQALKPAMTERRFKLAFPMRDS